MREQLTEERQMLKTRGKNRNMSIEQERNNMTNAFIHNFNRKQLTDNSIVIYNNESINIKLKGKI